MWNEVKEYLQKRIDWGWEEYWNAHDDIRKEVTESERMGSLDRYKKYGNMCHSCVRTDLNEDRDKWIHEAHVLEDVMHDLEKIMSWREGTDTYGLNAYDR